MVSPLESLPDAVIFDMDGLIFNSEVVFHTAWQMALVALGYAPLDHGRYLQLVGRSNDQAEQLMRQMLGADFPVEEFRRLWSEEWLSLVKTEGLTVKPGLQELLDWLDHIGLPRAVGTSSDRNEAEVSLKSAGLWRRFDTVVTASDTGVGKPAPDIFLKAAQELGVAPQRCLVLEDSNAGVAAAQAAGMAAIMVPDLQTPTEASRDWAVAIHGSLHDVLTQLRRTQLTCLT